MQDNKCQELKHDMDYVTSDAEVFDEFFNRFKRIQQSKEENEAQLNHPPGHRS